jgi:CRISPR-associated protein Cas1
VKGDEIMKGAKTVKVALNDFGAFLSRKEGCLVIRERSGKSRKYPLGENQIGAIEARTGNVLSVGALVSCAFWGIDLVIETTKGHPVGLFRGLDNSSHVLTRLCQYESIETAKGTEIAKKFVLGKLIGQDQLLANYGLRRHDYSEYAAVKNLEPDSLLKLRRPLNTIEGQTSSRYFQQLFCLLPEFLRPSRRVGYKAYDKFNNMLDLGYTVLSWRIHVALIKSKLEPYLGYLHSIQFGKPSLVCDFEELYRYLIDDFVIQFSQGLYERDFVLREEPFSSTRKCKRYYLKQEMNAEFTRKLNSSFARLIEIPRIKVGRKQKFETLISEEALLFAKYLRGEKTHWEPRIPELR